MVTKKRGFLMVTLLPLAGWCGGATFGMGGKLTLDGGLEIKGAAYSAGWTESVIASGFAFPDAKGACAFTLRLPDAATVKGRAVVTPAAEGAVHAVYTFTPQTDMTLNALFVSLRLPAAAWGGGQWSADAESGALPAARAGNSVFSGTVRTLACVSAAGERISLAFDAPTPVLIQDDRAWTETFSLRLGNNGEKKYAKGQPLTVAFTLRTQNPLALAYARPVVVRAGGEWAALDNEREIVPGSALDFSRMGFTDAPAGKHGWLKAVGPHFEFEKKPGAPQRFYGVNLCNTANFPSEEQAEALAERFARLGYNSVRVHHYDNGCVAGTGDPARLNADNMARLDALLAACFKRGLYVTTDLYVSRTVTWRDLGEPRDDWLDKQAFKGLVAVYEPAFRNWAAFARAFLTHVNPRTGRRYADEPGMPFIALINEGAIGYRDAGFLGHPATKAAWQAWAKEHGARFGALPDAPPADMSGRPGAACAAFIADIEGRMVTRMKAFLRDEIGCRALISNDNCGAHYTPAQAVRGALYDYVDDHFYVDHPRFPEPPRWRLPSACGNANPARAASPQPCQTAFTRLADKPFTVSEFNFAAPGMYRGAGGIMTGAMAALQDWSAVWRFAYSHSLDNLFSRETAVGYFDVGTDPLGQASERASLCLFLRGDLPPAEERLAYAVNDPGTNAVRVAPPWSRAAWSAQVATFTGDAPPSGWRGVAWGADRPPAATNRPCAFALDRARGAFTLDTPRTCGGFAESGRIAAGPLTADIRGAPATVWVSALDRAPVPASARLLLTHLTDVQNTGITYADAERKILLDWGTPPCLVRVGSAALSLALDAPERYTVYALATSGRRLGKVSARVEDGKLRFTAAVADAGGARMLYEIVQEK
jgi:hypothetical protein